MGLLGERGFGPMAPPLGNDHMDELSGEVSAMPDAMSVARAYGLTKQELLALEAYGDANKDKPRLKDIHDRVFDNTHFMGASDALWGNYQTGWRALESAMTKLPSLQSLGLGDLDLYRVERREGGKGKSVLFSALEKYAPNAVYVLHGAEQMSGGQRHYMSTSLMPSSHSSSLGADDPGLFKYKLKSARYQNLFSANSWTMDGGECLVPPDTVTLFKGFTQTPWAGGSARCASLEEVERGTLTFGVPCISDKDGSDCSRLAFSRGYYASLI